MTENLGFISVHRKLFDKGFARNPKYLAVWIYILSHANHETKEILANGTTILIERGSFLTSIKLISKFFNLSFNMTWRILNYFKTDNQIDIKTTNRYSIITVLNYELYQQNRKQNRKPVDNKQITDRYLIETTNNDNNENNDNTKYNDKNSDLKFLGEKTKIQIFIEQELKEVSKLKNQLTREQSEKLEKLYSFDLIQKKLKEMENYKKIQNYNSVYLTLQKWIENEVKNGTTQPQPPPEIAKNGKTAKWTVKPVEVQQHLVMDEKPNSRHEPKPMQNYLGDILKNLNINLEDVEDENDI